MVGYVCLFSREELELSYHMGLSLAVVTLLEGISVVAAVASSRGGRAKVGGNSFGSHSFGSIGFGVGSEKQRCQRRARLDRSRAERVLFEPRGSERSCRRGVRGVTRRLRWLRWDVDSRAIETVVAEWRSGILDRKLEPSCHAHQNGKRITYRVVTDPGASDGMGWEFSTRGEGSWKLVVVLIDKALQAAAAARMAWTLRAGRNSLQMVDSEERVTQCWEG
jgi:hypothetical protein